MAVPDFQSFFLPMLQFASDGVVHSLQETYRAMAEHFRLSQEDQREMLPSGKQATYKNRIGWAKVYLTKALLLESHKRGISALQSGGKNY